MAGRTLVGLDGTRESEAILPYVEELLRNEDADVTLVRVIPRDTPAAHKEARAYLRDRARRLSAKGGFADYRVLVGKPAPALTAYAEAEGYDRLALCSLGKSGLKRLLLGSTAEAVLRSAPVPVLVVQPGFKPGRVRKIVVGLDGTRVSMGVVESAAALAAAQGASVDVVNVVSMSGREKVTAEVAARNVNAARKQIKARGVKARVKVLFGDPAEETLRHADEVGADLIAVTTRGRTGTARWLEGSVTESLLRKGRRPLLVVRAEAKVTKASGAAAQRARRRGLQVARRMSVRTRSPYRSR